MATRDLLATRPLLTDAFFIWSYVGQVGTGRGNSGLSVAIDTLSMNSTKMMPHGLQPIIPRSQQRVELWWDMAAQKRERAFGRYDEAMTVSTMWQNALQSGNQRCWPFAGNRNRIRSNAAIRNLHFGDRDYPTTGAVLTCSIG